MICCSSGSLPREMRRKKKHVRKRQKNAEKRGIVGVGGVRKQFGTPVWLCLGLTPEVFSLLDEATQHPRAWFCPLLISPDLQEAEGFGGFHAGHDLSCCGAAAP